MSQAPLPPPAIVTMLDEEGIPWSWEYPGILVMEPVPGILVNTGLNGYSYGSIWEREDGADLGGADPTTASADSWRGWLRGFIAGHDARQGRVTRPEQVSK